MQSEEQRIIENLFSRLQQAEQNSAPRDAQAEQFIQSCLGKQPAAPYYMAQAMLVQEAAIKRLSEQVEQLKSQTAQQSSGGFLAGLFGGGSAPAYEAAQPRQPPAAGYARRRPRGPAVFSAARCKPRRAWPAESCWPIC